MRFRELIQEALSPEELALRAQLSQAIDDARAAFDTARTRANLQLFYAAANALDAFDAQHNPPPLETPPEDGYAGQHSAPMHDSGSPLHDLSGSLPADFYTGSAQQYSSENAERSSIAIALAMHHRPNAPITIYRAIPKGLPRKINVGDWVTLTKRYALQHGRENLRNEFQIVQKTVYARDLFTNGDSFQEWGYDPQPRVARSR